MQKRLSVEERPFMAALRQCKRMSPFRAEAYKAKSIEFLDAALKSRSSTFVPARRASSETTMVRILKAREFLRFAE